MHETRQQRHRVSGFNQPHMRLQIGSDKTNIRFKTGDAAGLLRPVARRGTHRFPPPRQRCRIRYRSDVVVGATTHSERRERQLDAVVGERYTVEAGEVPAGVAGILFGHHEIKLPGPDFAECRLGFVLFELNPQLGC